MKRLIPFVLLLALLLSACSKPAPAPQPYTTADLETLLEQPDLFNTELAQVDGDLAAMLYALDASTVTEAHLYMAVNTSVSADELALFLFENNNAATAAVDICQARINGQIEVCRSYCPAAVPRLESAVVSQVGNSVLVVVGSPELSADQVTALNT